MRRNDLIRKCDEYGNITLRMIPHVIQLRDIVNLEDGTSGKVICIRSKEYIDWSGDDMDFSYITDDGIVRSANIDELLYDD
jgi:hypothetical protein